MCLESKSRTEKMSGYDGRHFAFANQRQYEEQWAADALMMNEDGHQGGDGHQPGGGVDPVDTPPLGLMQSNRTDSINSTTVFVDPNEIQPQHGGSRDYLSSAEHYHHQQRQKSSPQKRLRQQQQQQQQEQQETGPSYSVLLSADGRVAEQVININVPVASDNHEAEKMKQEVVTYNIVQPPSPGGNESSHSWITEVNTHSLPAGHPPISPTGLDPSTTNWPGSFFFDVSFIQISQHAKNKHWDYSKRLKKLYIDMNKFVKAEFRVGESPPEGMYIRALPVYATTTHSRHPVQRCPNHASPNDPTNVGFLYTNHLIRVQDERAEYCEDPTSRRLSVVFPVTAPHQGTSVVSNMLKFMCLGSDVGGINRKPVSVIFTLEDGAGQVVGRRVVDVRICSCPKRDMQQEEERLDRQEQQARDVGKRLAETSMVMGPPAKKTKKLMKKGEEIIMIPVAAEDFKKLNEFAEAAMVVRHPEKASEIKEMRRKLLQQHNEELIQSLEKKK